MPPAWRRSSPRFTPLEPEQKNILHRPAARSGRCPNSARLPLRNSIHPQAMQALQPPPSVEAGLAKAQARLSLAAQPGLDAKALLAAVPQHLAFLRAAHRAGVSLRAPSAKTLERYASKWLPLLATADEGAALAPPPDVAWAWHCHRLAPQSYARTARRLGLPETKPFLIQAEGATQNATQKAWAAAYPDEPFFLEGDSGDDAGALVLDGFDVAAAAERQRTFLWQVSGPRFDEGYFLHDGVKRYENFLRLMRSGEFLVPTYQIDLFWHTHILASASTYAADTRRLCGFELPHDDSVNDRAEGSKLNRQYAVTQKLWAETYGERYAVRGGMYRDEPPEAYFDATWKKETVPIRWRLREAGVSVVARRRLVVCVAALASCGALTVLLPSLLACHGTAQARYGLRGPVPYALAEGRRLTNDSATPLTTMIRETGGKK